MKAVYASKLYKASTRKDKIRSAINDPRNQELVKQLREYLDDEYLTPEYVDVPEAPTEVEEVPAEPDAGESAEPNTVSPAGPSKSSFGKLSDDFDKFSDKLDEPTGEPEAQSAPVEPAEEGAEPVGESTAVSGQPIKGSECRVDLNSMLNVISGTLNSREDTAGVARILIKGDSELWIYYKDSVNLNNVMEPVIKLLNDGGYTYLEFNRLARTDNAIVFQILDAATPIAAVAQDEE